MIAGRMFAFKRDTSFSPVMVPATPLPSRKELGRLPNGVTSFAMVNAYPFYMRLLGSGSGGVGTFKPVAEGDGWLIPPGHFGVYSTQNPTYLSAMAVDRPGFPIKDTAGNAMYPNAALELFYGSGL